MARKALIEREKRRMELVSRHFEKRQALKKIISSENSSDEERLEAVIKLNKMPRDSSPIRIRRRCQFTGRPRGYLRKFKMSRICFRQMANEGLVPGMFKASW
ncbi:MAG: 30S ribosomal protein S14 [Rhabdochlamydiaceae bacterium]|nr:30S ribosomal protein S14 [Candidatus Amphrikana amoebophyrae]